MFREPAQRLVIEAASTEVTEDFGTKEKTWARVGQVLNVPRAFTVVEVTEIVRAAEKKADEIIIRTEDTRE